MKRMTAKDWERQLARDASAWEWTRTPPAWWCMLSVEVQHEATAAHILRKKGIEAVPLIYQRWKKASKFYPRRKVLGDKVLMPGVVFAKLPPAPNWMALCSLKPVRRVVCPSGKPLALSDEEFAKMQIITARLCQKPHHKPMPTNMVFEVGDTAEFIAGPLEGYKASVREIDGRMGRVLVEMFGVEREVNADLASLGKIA